MLGCEGKCRKVLGAVGEGGGVEKSWEGVEKCVGVWGNVDGGLLGFSMPPFTLPPQLLSIPSHPNTFSHTFTQHFLTNPTLLSLTSPHPNTLFTPLSTSPLRLFSHTPTHFSIPFPTLFHTSPHYFTPPSHPTNFFHTLTHLATLFTLTPIHFPTPPHLSLYFLYFPTLPHTPTLFPTLLHISPTFPTLQNTFQQLTQHFSTQFATFRRDRCDVRQLGVIDSSLGRLDFETSRHWGDLTLRRLGVETIRRGKV